MCPLFAVLLAGSGSGGAGPSSEPDTQQQDLQEAQEREYQQQMEQLRQQCAQRVGTFLPSRPDEPPSTLHPIVAPWTTDGAPLAVCVRTFAGTRTTPSLSERPWASASGASLPIIWGCVPGLRLRAVYQWPGASAWGNPCIQSCTQAAVRSGGGAKVVWFGPSTLITLCICHSTSFAEHGRHILR